MGSAEANGHREVMPGQWEYQVRAAFLFWAAGIAVEVTAIAESPGKLRDSNERLSRKIRFAFDILVLFLKII